MLNFRDSFITRVSGEARSIAKIKLPKYENRTQDVTPTNLNTTNVRRTQIANLNAPEH